ncbi:MAG: SDR family NAD(P)-dependent oxidoreductase [Chloroflexi bacterium CFX4]|nr:SDR family NAD(P)-dependent oxidoreductase [Chloroflexi bacterium CFX4]MDL1923299.1 SDR family NAD(P)-dependent oxidoreductase [Chloroflexi bacterium CFX3]
MAIYPELAGKVAVLSGAGGNLGMALVRRFQAAGIKLALVDHKGDTLRQRLREAGVDDADILIGALDLTQKRAAIDEFVTQVVAQHGKVDILVNVAGGFKAGGPVHEMDEEIWDFLMNMNAKTAFLLSAAVARSMVMRRVGGRIVNVAARAALSGAPTLSGYSASKSAVLRLTESMAAELMQYGITVNAVMPSVIDTPQNRKNDPDADHSKWVTPESLADVILFLVSESARDISGAALPVYGRA